MTNRHPLFLSLVLLSLLISACKTKQKTSSITTTTENSRLSLDWAGTYKNVLPCDNCPGVQTVIEINEDGTYSLVENYLGKEQKTVKCIGSFTWNKAGGIITLDHNGEKTKSYLVGENKLVQLDTKGSQMMREQADKYTLRKVPGGIIEKYWRLTELGGKPIVQTENNKREAHLIFKQENAMVVGSAGCNSITSSYTLDDENGLSFGLIASTKMLCADMTIEDELLAILPMVNRYQLESGKLNLYGSEDTVPLATFVVVHLF